MSTSWVCLMYHDIVTENTAGQHPETYFAVSASGFKENLRTIRELGRVGRSLEEVITGGSDGVAITFDDGNSGQYDHAFHALVEHEMTATFFVTTDWVGRAGFVSWDQLREMQAGGMSIQSHTASHPFLSELGRVEAEDQLRRSKERIDEELSQDTQSLALPGGDHVRRRDRDLIERVGYRIVATSRWGVNRSHPGGPVAQVRRCTVRGSVPADAFARVVAGDRAMWLRKRPRESVLGAVRRTVGPTRYAAWRSRVLRANGSRVGGDTGKSGDGRPD